MKLPSIVFLAAGKGLVPGSEKLRWMHGNEAELRKNLAAHRATKYGGITQPRIHVYPRVSSDTGAPPTDESTVGDSFRLGTTFLTEVSQKLPAHGVVFQVFPYTDDPTVYAKLLDLGVMSFATDYPDITLRELKAYYAGRPTAKTKK